MITFAALLATDDGEHVVREMLRATHIQSSAMRQPALIITSTLINWHDAGAADDLKRRSSDDIS